MSDTLSAKTNPESEPESIKSEPGQALRMKDQARCRMVVLVRLHL